MQSSTTLFFMICTHIHLKATIVFFFLPLRINTESGLWCSMQQIYGKRGKNWVFCADDSLTYAISIAQLLLAAYIRLSFPQMNRDRKFSSWPEKNREFECTNNWCFISSNQFKSHNFWTNLIGTVICNWHQRKCSDRQRATRMDELKNRDG